MAVAIPNPPRTRRFPIFHFIFHRCATDSPEQVLACGPCGLHGLIAMNDRLKLIQDRTVPPAALYFFAHDGKGLFREKSLAVGPVGGKCVVDVRDWKDAGGEWNLFTFQPIWVPGAILLFMMVANDRQHVAERPQRGANFFTDHGVLLHDFSFFRSQRSGFEKDV